MTRIDPDAVMWSTPEAQRAGRPLIVLLHGYGSHEGDLFQLAPSLPLGATIASVRAPRPLGAGWAWFDLDPERLDRPAREEVDAVAEALLDWLRDARGDAPLVVLLGFSQGGALAIEALRREPESADAIVVLSGFAVAGDRPGDDELATRRPRAFWGRGLLDDVITPRDVERTDAVLTPRFDLVRGIYEDLAHGVSPDELRDVVAFLRSIVGS